MTEVQTAWLAGLYEGEGSAVLRRRIAGGERKYAVVTLHSTDLDVLERAQSLTGVGKVYAYQRGDAKPHWKQIWNWQVTKGQDAADLLEAILPHLCERRRQRAMDVIAGHYAAFPVHCTSDDEG